MTTRYDRMRAAAGDKHRRGTSMIGTVYDHDLGVQLCEEAKQLRADADALEAVEREMREWANGPEGASWMVRIADRIRGET